MVTSGASFQNREFYVMTASGMTNGFIAAQSGKLYAQLHQECLAG